MATMTITVETQQETVTVKPCRFCGAALEHTFVDLGMSPLCETYPAPADLNRGEIYYPLHVYVCSGSAFWFNSTNTKVPRISLATTLISRHIRIPGSSMQITTAPT